MRATTPASFDRSYYQRFYASKRTRVHSAKEVAQLAIGVTGLLDWWKVDLRSVLDVGAGTGLWRDWFRRARPHVRYRSIEVSAYACEKYGHEQRDIARWRGRERYDLIVCQGVLPYLADREASAALENLGAMCRGFLYLEAITRGDLLTVCDRALTDVHVHERSATWYRRRLSAHFQFVGAGLYYAKGGPLGFYELEAR